MYISRIASLENGSLAGSLAGSVRTWSTHPSLSPIRAHVLQLPSKLRFMRGRGLLVEARRRYCLLRWDDPGYPWILQRDRRSAV